MSVFSLLRWIENRFDWQAAQVMLHENRGLTVVLSTIYVVLIFLGRRWMMDRPALKIRRLLVMWNTGLASFSILGFVNVFPSFAQNLRTNGFQSSVCRGDGIVSGPNSASVQLWCLLFLLSKAVEFGDTAFIVLRKTPLSFLHWFHHVTVYMYSNWFAGSAGNTAIIFWFGTLNYFVHSIMYSYYTLKSMGLRIPGSVARIVTLLQLAQFAVAMTTIISAYYLKTNGVECDAPYDLLYTGMVIYAAYFILFINFFVQRYLKKVN